MSDNKQVQVQPPMPESGSVSTGSLVLNAGSMEQVINLSNFMAGADIMVPKHLMGKSADLAAIVMQAMCWNMNPFSVAQQTFLVSGTLGYSAQLVSAVITSSTAITGRFHYEYSDGWEKLAGKVKPGAKGPVKDWSKADEAGLWIRVGAILRGESEIQWGEKLYLASIMTRNSPLWVTNPKQQMAYLDLKYWSRIYAPQVILGVYTPEELNEIPAQAAADESPIKVPEKKLERVDEDQQPEGEKPASQGEAEPAELVPDTEAAEAQALHESELFDSITESISRCETGEHLTAVKEEIQKETEQKSDLQYKLIDAWNVRKKFLTSNKK